MDHFARLIQQTNDFSQIACVKLFDSLLSLSIKQGISMHKLFQLCDMSVRVRQLVSEVGSNVHRQLVALEA